MNSRMRVIGVLIVGAGSLFLGLIDHNYTNAAAPPCNNYISNSTPPENIGVAITNPADHTVILDVVYVDFKSYVKDVLPNEWSSGWKSAAYQAGAVWYLSDTIGSSGHSITPFGFGTGGDTPLTGRWAELGNSTTPTVVRGNGLDLT